MPSAPGSPHNLKSGWVGWQVDVEMVGWGGEGCLGWCGCVGRVGGCGECYWVSVGGCAWLVGAGGGGDDGVGSGGRVMVVLIQEWWWSWFVVLVVVMVMMALVLVWGISDRGLVAMVVSMVVVVVGRPGAPLIQPNRIIN